MAGARRVGAGGIGRLRRLVAEYGEAIDADLQAHYRLSLADLVTGRLTHRRLWTLVRQLPPGSAYARAVLGAEQAAWTVDTHLLAVITDAVLAANWQRGGGKGPRPKRIQRPGATAAGRRVGRAVRTPAEVRGYLDQFKPKE